ncbi:MAG: DUF1573 domain-containing protein [Prevotellaceae bacterium]|nr:DUF1573 domain-containing protein [Prevotellaceae bacterium]
MRKLSVLLLLAALSAAAQAGAVISFKKTTHNFGTFAEDKTQTCVFEFSNTGDAPLIVTQVHASCGCTVASFTQQELKPGEKGKVTVTYNGKGKPLEYFKRALFVRSNASNSLVRLYIEGTMKK